MLSSIAGSCAPFPLAAFLARWRIPFPRDAILPRRRGTLPTAVTFVHTACVPTASSTGTRSTGTLLLLSGVRPQPTTATLTGSSMVNHVCLQSTQRRWRVTRSVWLPLVAIALISPLLHRGHSIGIIQKYTAIMAQ